MGTRPLLTVSDAVAAFEVERRTLQRLLSSGRLDGSHKDVRGRWVIPIEALHAAGFMARQTWKDDATNSAQRRDTDATLKQKSSQYQRENDATQDATQDATDLRHRVAQLEGELAAEKRLREASERNADDLRAAMRMLEAAPPKLPERPKRKWFRQK